MDAVSEAPAEMVTFEQGFIAAGGRDGINSGAFEGTITDLYMRNKG
jgi:hypothetical protein